MRTNKRQVIAVLTGRSNLTAIEYKGINFKYCANMTIKNAKEYIEDRIAKA